MNETKILTLIRNTLGRREDTRMFRNNVGTLRDKDGRYITYGLCNGSSDLIGWRSIVIGPEHIGKEVAIFTAIEVKTDKGIVTKDQANFLSAVFLAGGISGVARTIEEAETIIQRSINGVKNGNDKV